MPGPFQPQPVNFFAAANPSLYQQQAALGQQQAIASQMMGEGLQPISPTRSSGRFLIRTSPLEAAAHSGQALAAAMMQRNINQRQAILANQQLQAMASFLRGGGQQGTPGAAGGTGSVGEPGTPGTPAGAPGAPLAQPQGSQQSDPFENYMRLGVIGQTFGPQAAQVAAAGMMPTDLEKNIAGAGYAAGSPQAQGAYQHALNPSLSTRYGIYSPDPNHPGNYNITGGALPPNAIPIQNGPGGPQAQLYPGQAEAAGTLSGTQAGAQAAARTPYELTEVTLADGRKIRVPVSSLTGLQAPGAQAVSTPQGFNPGAQGQTTTGEERQKGIAKSSNEYVDQLRSDAATAIQQNRMMDELDKSLQNFTPGKLAAFRKSLAQWKVQVGIATPEDKNVAASAETGDKITGQLVSSALRRLSARPSQMEFQIFKDQYVPNLQMTPQGAQQVVQFMRQVNNLDALKYEQFNQWKRQQPQDTDYRDFDIEWNKKAPGLPLTSPSSYPRQQFDQVKAMGAPNPQDIVDELRRRGVVK